MSGHTEMLQRLRAAALSAAQRGEIQAWSERFVGAPDILFNEARYAIRYLRSPVSEEALTDPYCVLTGQLAADADDAAVAVAAAYAAAGFTCRLVLHAFDDNGERFVHVIVEVETSPGAWRPADVLFARHFGELARVPTGERCSEWIWRP